jgi:hypothetical protein
MTDNNDAMLVGGPRDGQTMTTGGDALIEVEIDGLLHRYIKTTTERDGHPAYNYDGVVDPNGAESGVEDARARLASPAARDDD